MHSRFKAPRYELETDIVVCKFVGMMVKVQKVRVPARCAIAHFTTSSLQNNSLIHHNSQWSTGTQ